MCVENNNEYWLLGSLYVCAIIVLKVSDNSAVVYSISDHQKVLQLNLLASQLSDLFLYPNSMFNFQNLFIIEPLNQVGL